MQRENTHVRQKILFAENKKFVATNMALIRNLGDSEAILLNYLLGLRDYFNKPSIYRTSKKIAQDLNWSESKVGRLIKKLVDLNIMEIKIKAWPGTHNFYFNEARIRDAIFDNMKKPRKNHDSCQNDKSK